MKKLLLALPLPGVGVFTIASHLRTRPGIQVINYYEFVLGDLAVDFGVSTEFMLDHLNEPSNALTFMQHSAPYRAEAKLKHDDFYTPRTAGFHIRRYLGEMRFSDTRLKRMLGAVSDMPGQAKRNLVFFNVATGQNDIPFFQTYAKETGREFILVDLTRSGVPGLAERRYRLAGGVHVDNREGQLQETVQAFLQLISN